MKKKRRFSNTKILTLAGRIGRFLVKSQLLTLMLVLCALGFLAGFHASPNPQAIPYEELFENLSVRSYKRSPADSSVRFVVELAARGRVFQQYDLDELCFRDPPSGHDYRRTISGTRYAPLKVRGHVDQGFWLELPETPARPLATDQFDELYRTSLDYLKPVSAVAVVFGAISGYSTGYRLAAWSTSLSNPAVQKRLLGTHGIGRSIAREAWRRVLLEPVVMANETDAGRFASARGAQRVYTNFFKLALNDSNLFIPHEAARLDSAGRSYEARTMVAFARAVRRAAQDNCDLTSADFLAVEAWASLLDERGHWAAGALPPAGKERLQYIGTLTWYGIAPAVPSERRLWVGPRVLVKAGDVEGFVADEIPLDPIGCPIGWRSWLRENGTYLSKNAWTAQFMGDMRQFVPIVQIGRGVATWLVRVRIPSFAATRWWKSDISASSGDAPPETLAAPKEPVRPQVERAPVRPATPDDAAQRAGAWTSPPMPFRGLDRVAPPPPATAPRATAGSADADSSAAIR